MQSFAKTGIETRHIKDFHQHDHVKHPIFYGMLRGTGMALRQCQDRDYPFWYLDNGYFDAVYMDSLKRKDMSGTYRLVKNEMIEQYTGKPILNKKLPLHVLVLPPTPYSAFMHDTTPEDWMQKISSLVNHSGDKAELRDKGETIPFSEAIKEYDAVISFNSMGVMEAARQGLAIYDTHGLFRNIELFETNLPYYNYGDLKDYYTDKQFTLDEISEGKCLL